MDYVAPRDTMNEVRQIPKKAALAAAVCFPAGFVIPAGMMFGAPASLSTWRVWNQIPVTIGNIVSGVLFTGAALYALNPAPRAGEAAAGEPAIALAVRTEPA